ncbi:MAG: glutamine--fructose-6-phosphate aminotransferase, partial [Bombella apis]|nr:glutamine--fructose-6-phosphate aminotransferase [Bombella apis]
MCGICGVVGHRPATPIVFEGLRRLEYRGYDSSGIATVEHGRLARCRAAGKLDNLAKALEETPLSGTTGIGHTRWATHGAPTTNNAHPHRVGKVAIVHNGIIENFSDLKKTLEAGGRTFETETDSEAVAHLLDEHIQNGLPPKEAAFATIRQLQGAYAIAMIFEGHDNLLIGARHGAPLAIGYGEGEMFLGSDSLALAPLSSQISYLEDGDWCVLTREHVEILDGQGRAVERPIQTASLTTGQI